MMTNSTFSFLVAVVACWLAATGCTHNPRGERALAGSDSLPGYIAAPPLGDSIGVMIGSRSSPYASGMPGGIGDGPDVSQYVDAFRPALLEALRARGYRAEYLGRPQVTCSNMGTAFCFQQWESGDGVRLREMLRAKGLSTGLIVQLNYRPEGFTFRAVEGGPDIRPLTLYMDLYLQDASGLMLRAGVAPLRRAGERITLTSILGPTSLSPFGQTRYVGKGPDGRDAFARKTADEWGAELAVRFVERNVPRFSPNEVASPQEIEKTLTSRKWQAVWTYNKDADGGLDGSGRHLVSFERRGEGVVAFIAADPVIGIGPTEAPVTITPVGITYFIPTFGRARLAFQRESQSFGGGTITQVLMQKLPSLLPSDEKIIYVATMQLRPQ